MTSTSSPKLNLARSPSIEDSLRRKILKPPTARKTLTSPSPSKSSQQLKPVLSEPIRLDQTFQKDRATPERTYLLSTIIETNTARKGTFKSFVSDNYLKNAELERKVKLSDVRVNRNTSINDLQIQQKTRLTYLESRKNRSGTMFMPEFWCPNFHAKVLKESGLSKMVRDVRRCRYQTKSQTGERLERNFKDKHPDHKQAQDSEEISHLMGHQTARITTSRSQNFLISRHTPQTSARSDPHLAEKDDAQIVLQAKQPNVSQEDSQKFQRKGNRSSSTPALKHLHIGSSANKSPGQPSLLSLNILDEFNTELVASLNNADLSRPTTSRMPSSRVQGGRPRLQIGEPTGKLYAKIEDLTRFTRSTREATESTKRDTLSSFRGLFVRTSRGGRHNDQINDILNNCDRVQENTGEMMSQVHKMQDLIHLAHQNHRNPEDILDVEENVEEEIKFTSDENLHSRYFKRTMKRARKSFPKYLVR